jgi:hypothetical protein
MKLRFCLTLLLLLALFAAPALSQDIVIDWKTKEAIVSPAEVSKVFNGRLVVKNVNDVVFTYKVEVVTIPRPVGGDDAKHFLAMVGTRSTFMAAAEKAKSPCRELVTEVANQIVAVSGEMKNLLNPKMSGEKAESRPLEDTLKYWAEKTRPAFGSLEKAADDLIASIACAEDEKRQALAAYAALRERLDLLQARIDLPHQIEQPVIFSPDTDYKVTIEEIYINEKGKTFPVIDGKREFSFSPASHVLSLSAGALLTTLPQHSYLDRRDPASGNNVVVVEGTGLARPIGVALLNYQIPHARWMRNDQVGLNLASGLTFDLGSTKSDTAGVGWFGGVSLDFYHRLFITPGIHFGEFADFPVGFGNGSVIPDNFGEMNPVKRWTGRFAISITYRTASFAKTAAASEPKASEPKE